MAFVVAKANGRFEIRESVHTASGPRARTLATFRVLAPDVLDRAARAATRPFDADEVRVAARRAGAPVAEPEADQAARVLIAEAAAGRFPAPGLVSLLRQHLSRAAPSPVLEAGESAAEWMRASDRERGDALRDLLELTDHLPARRRGPLRFPSLRAAGDD